MALRQAFPNTRWEIVERVDFLAVNPYLDARRSQRFSELIHLLRVPEILAPFIPEILAG